MKKVSSFISVLVLTLLLVSCNKAKSDGIYKTKNGWDIVEEGRTYSYICEPDGLYLYIDWEGKSQYTLDFRYNDDIFRKTVGYTGNFSATTLKFLCKNKDGKYVYVAGWDEFDGCFHALKDIMFQVDASGQPIYSYANMRQTFSLMEKYTNN